VSITRCCPNRLTFCCLPMKNWVYSNVMRKPLSCLSSLRLIMVFFRSQSMRWLLMPDCMHVRWFRRRIREKMASQCLCGITIIKKKLSHELPESFYVWSLPSIVIAFFVMIWGYGVFSKIVQIIKFFHHKILQVCRQIPENRVFCDSGEWGTVLWRGYARGDRLPADYR